MQLPEPVRGHQKRRELRQRLRAVLNALASGQRDARYAQVFTDLSCMVGLTGPLDYTRLPANPDGFTAGVTSYRSKDFRIVCLFQVVSMAVMYAWLYSRTEDSQDARSAGRYVDWLEEYVKAPDTYTVACVAGLRMFLWPYKQGDKPHVPEWVGEETI